MTLLKKWTVGLILAATVTGMLGACNTMEGLGRDASAAGQAITGAAQKTRGY